MQTRRAKRRLDQCHRALQQQLDAQSPGLCRLPAPVLLQCLALLDVYAVLALHGVCTYLQQFLPHYWTGVLRLPRWHPMLRTRWLEMAQWLERRRAAPYYLRHKWRAAIDATTLLFGHGRISVTCFLYHCASVHVTDVHALAHDLYICLFRNLLAYVKHNSNDDKTPPLVWTMDPDALRVRARSVRPLCHGCVSDTLADTHPNGWVGVCFWLQYGLDASTAQTTVRPDVLTINQASYAVRISRSSEGQPCARRRDDAHAHAYRDAYLELALDKVKECARR